MGMWRGLHTTTARDSWKSHKATVPRHLKISRAARCDLHILQAAFWGSSLCSPLAMIEKSQMPASFQSNVLCYTDKDPIESASDNHVNSWPWNSLVSDPTKFAMSSGVILEAYNMKIRAGLGIDLQYKIHFLIFSQDYYITIIPSTKNLILPCILPIKFPFAKLLKENVPKVLDFRDRWVSNRPAAIRPPPSLVLEALKRRTSWGWRLMSWCHHVKCGVLLWLMLIDWCWLILIQYGSMNFNDAEHRRRGLPPLLILPPCCRPCHCHGHRNREWSFKLAKINTLPETNIAPENRPSQKPCHLPTIKVQVLCWFQGG